MTRPMTQSDIDSAIEKIRTERQKVLDEARAIIQRNDRDELLFLIIHQNHLMRVMRVVKGAELDKNAKALCRLAEEAYTYTLQLAYKYGRRRDGVRLADYYRLIKISRFVNNGFEMEAMLKYFPFERFGERLQHFKIYLGTVTTDESRSRIFEYAARQELDSALRQVTWMSVEKLISELFPPAMDPEFIQAFGLSTEEVTDFYSALASEVSSKLTQAEQLMPKLAPDRIDVARLESFQVARFAYTLEYERFLNHFGLRKQSFRNFFLTQTLRREQVNESELRYFAVWRHHLLRLDRKHFTFSPEITNFSPNIGLHYALLEDARTRDSYQAKRAVQFQGRVESILNSSGMRIVARNLGATLGKRDIGDVDILAEDRNNYFNIECKGAILPLRVYFHDFEYIRDVHLPYLRDTKGWERKVVAREEWLETRRAELGLLPEKPITSLIISDSPEILSHYSKIPCLSLHEFPLWYSAAKQQDRLLTFDEFMGQILQKEMAAPTDDSRDDIEEYLGVRFERDSP